jgi:putative phosphoribosyl transferase
MKLPFRIHLIMFCKGDMLTVEQNSSVGFGRIKEFRELRDRSGIFEDRIDAGTKLARLVKEEELRSPLVLAIPSGGVPVAAAVSESLSCPLDVAVVSKITLPWNSEVGYGAVAFDGSCRLNEDLIRSIGMSEIEVSRGIETTRAKVARRTAMLQGNRSLPDLSAHDLILVDDGLASGFTMLVAVEALYRAGARLILVAVPTGHVESVQKVAEQVATVCCANLRNGYPFAVASAYRNWTDVCEAEALLILLHGDRPFAQ